ncbi:MAG: hypothetical protein ACR2HX_04275 [Pyrinomonadaceae bacterium]
MAVNVATVLLSLASSPVPVSLPIGDLLMRGDDSGLLQYSRYGWWYTAGLPDGRRLIACMTDADLARRMRLHDAEEWRRKLAAMRNGRVPGRLGKAPGPKHLERYSTFRAWGNGRRIVIRCAASVEQDRILR